MYYMKQFILSFAILVFSIMGIFHCCWAHCSETTKNREDCTERPNIIYILADDLGYGDLGCYGQTKIKTPNLDKMAHEGIRFTNHYSGQTVCSPSRCSLMTGMHMGHASVKRNGQLLNVDDITVPNRGRLLLRYLYSQ